jgi:hypothetical protein
MEGGNARAGAIAKSAAPLPLAPPQIPLPGRTSAIAARGFPAISPLPRPASPSHDDDATMRRIRMTIAALSKRIDARFRRAESRTTQRFDAVDERFAAVDARFDRMDAALATRFGRLDHQIESVGEKLDRIAAILDDKYKHQEKTLDEHERRLRDLERTAQG